MTIVVFSHTPPKFFDSISRLINNLYQQISDKPFVLSNTVPKFFTSMDEKVGIMKNVARLIWLIAHGCFYYRDSKKAFNNISFALILCFGLKVCESTGAQSLNLALFNELALFIPSMECFVQEFPACFNVDYGGYPALLEKFSLAESEEKLFALEEEFGEFHKKVREELGIPETVLMKEKKNEGLPQTDMFRGKKQGENSAAQNLKGKEEESSVEFRTG